MAASRSTNTQSEALRGLLGQLADMKVMPDADIPYLTNLETMILGYLRAPFEAQQAQQQMAAGQAQQQVANPQQQMNPAAMGGIPVQAMQGRVPGTINHGSMPPVDELRRLISGGQ